MNLPYSLKLRNWIHYTTCRTNKHKLNKKLNISAVNSIPTSKAIERNQSLPGMSQHLRSVYPAILAAIQSSCFHCHGSHSKEMQIEFDMFAHCLPRRCSGAWGMHTVTGCGEEKRSHWRRIQDGVIFSEVNKEFSENYSTWLNCRNNDYVKKV